MKHGPTLGRGRSSIAILCITTSTPERLVSSILANRPCLEKGLHTCSDSCQTMQNMPMNWFSFTTSASESVSWERVVICSPVTSMKPSLYQAILLPPSLLKHLISKQGRNMKCLYRPDYESMMAMADGASSSETVRSAAREFPKWLRWTWNRGWNRSLPMIWRLCSEKDTPLPLQEAHAALLNNLKAFETQGINVSW